MKKSLLYLCVLYVVVRWYNGRRTNVKLTRSGILAPRMAPWLRLLHYGDNHSFLTLTGFTRVVFRRLEAVLLEGEPPRKGRTPELDFTGQLGLYLLYLGSRMALKQLCLIFGIVPSTASVFINRFAKMVPKKLRHEAHAEVRFPSQQRMAELADLVHRREPGVRNIIGFVDGLPLPGDRVQGGAAGRFLVLFVQCVEISLQRDNRSDHSLPHHLLVSLPNDFPVNVVRRLDVLYDVQELARVVIWPPFAASTTNSGHWCIIVLHLQKM
jgi:hypothetical protein